MSGMQQSSPAASIKLNKQQEDDLIRELQQQSMTRLEVDPLKELDEALMDRTTAQQTLKGKTVNLQKVKINSSNFEKGSH